MISFCSDAGRHKVIVKYTGCFYYRILYCPEVIKSSKVYITLKFQIRYFSGVMLTIILLIADSQFKIRTLGSKSVEPVKNYYKAFFRSCINKAVL